MQYYLFLKRRRELPYGLNSYILSCLTTNIDFFKQNFVVCTWCIAKFSASTVAMLFGLSEPLQFPEPEVSLAECCYRGLLNANMVVGRKRNPRLFTNFPSSHGLDTRGFMVVR